MATHRTPLAPDDLLDLPVPDHLSGYELVDGKLVPVTPASPRHGDLIVEVAYRLKKHVEAQALTGRVWSDAGFVLDLKRDPGRLRGPDVAYVSEAKLRVHGDPGEHFARFVPDLAIEIDLSSGRKPGGLQRIRDYLEAGVPLVWTIDAGKRNATVYRQDGSITHLTEHDTLDGEDIVPGFRLPLNVLFR